MGTPVGETSSADVPSVREIFRTKGFPTVFAANSISTWGDYIARLTIASVVYDRTGSALATAATFAVSLMPTLLGRGLLSGLADRFSYRDVIIACQQTRAVLAATLVLAVMFHAPIALMLVLLFVLELAGGPTIAANQMLLTDWFPEGAKFARAFGLSTLANQVNQAIGFVLGGSIVALTGPALALSFDVVTFVVAIIAYLVVVPRRPPPQSQDAAAGGFLGDLRTALRALVANRVLVALLALSIVSVPAIAAPEAVAIPYAAAHGWSRAWRGLLLAAPVIGAVLGLLVLGRWSAVRQSRCMLPMALAMPIPLLVTALEPSAGLLWLAWFVSGVLQTFMLPLQACYSLFVPPHLRGRLFGLAGAVSVAGNGAAFLLAGWLSQHTNPGAAVGVCAVVSVSGAILVVSLWPRLAFDRAVDQAYVKAAAT